MQQPVKCPLCRSPALDGPIAPEAPGAWRAPRIVCAQHARDAVLPNGKRLAEVLAGAASLDAPGLPYLFSPVKVGGFTAWPQFAANHWYLDASLGWDPFEVAVSHDPVWLDVLWQIAPTEVRRDGEPADVFSAFAAEAGPAALEGTLALARHLRRRDAYQAALRGLDKPCADSLDEANAITRRVETQMQRDGEESLAALVERFRAIVSLAHRRFGGIAQFRAIDFESELPMAQLRERLRLHTGWIWHHRDSDALGEYTSSSHAGMLFKVYDEHGDGNGPHYTLALGLAPYCRHDVAAITAVGEGLIAAVDGRNPRPGRIGDWR